MTTKAEEDPMVRREALVPLARAYVPDGDFRKPLAAPLYADLRGLPPLLIQVGTAEVLLDDAVRLAERAGKAGVDVTLEPWDHMIHVWHLFAGQLPEGRAAIQRIGEFLRERWG
jgi:acetyl esterase/lipase